MPNVAQRVGWAVLVAATLYVCYFSNLGVIGFVGPDEPRYAWIARDMAETGDWVTPRLYGRPWFEKPPLLYWAGAFFFKLLGEGRPELAARLPSAISALLATLALAWLAWRTSGEECARWLLLLLPTSAGVIGFSHAAATDMPFAGMLTVAMVCAAVVLGLSRSDEDTPILPYTPWATLLLFGFFLGLAVLAKGPAALILCGGAVFLCAGFTKRWRDALRLLHPAAIASFCVTALPWYILCARRNPDFFRVFIIEHNFKRYLTAEFQHIQPFWFYLPVLLAAFLPWTPLLVAVGVTALARFRHSRMVDSVCCLPLSWTVSCLLFFGFSKSKLPGYILPAVLPMGFLLAYAISGRAWFSRRLSAYALTASGGLYFSATLWAGFSNKGPAGLLHGGTPWAAIKLVVFLSFGLFAFSCFFAGLSFWTKSNSFLRISLIASSIFALILIIGLIPRVLSETHYNLLSGKELWRVIPPDARSSTGLRVLGFRRDYRYALNFYLHREIPDWTEDQTQTGYVVAKRSGSDKSSASCDSLKTASDCQDLWANDHADSHWSLLKITPRSSLAGLGGRGQPKQEK